MKAPTWVFSFCPASGTLIKEPPQGSAGVRENQPAELLTVAVKGSIPFYPPYDPQTKETVRKDVKTVMAATEM